MDLSASAPEQAKVVQPDYVFFPPKHALMWHYYSKNMRWHADMALRFSLSQAYMYDTWARNVINGVSDGIAAM